MRCNATIDVGGKTLACRRDDPRLIHYSEDGSVEWTDDAPGAVPHREPKWTAKQVEAFSGSVWSVADERGRLAATFPPPHPDAEGAAKAEAARLNGTAADLVDVGELLRDRDEAVADWKQAVLAQQEACRERDRAVDETKRYAARADRYRETLEVIAQTDDGPWMRRHAQRALEGVSRD